MTRTCGTNSRPVMAIVASRGVGRPLPFAVTSPRGSRYTTAVRRSVRSAPCRSTTAIWPLTTACAGSVAVGGSSASEAETSAAPSRRRGSELKADRKVEVLRAAGDARIELGRDPAVLEADDHGLGWTPEQVAGAHAVASPRRPIVFVGDIHPASRAGEKRRMDARIQLRPSGVVVDRWTEPGARERPSESLAYRAPAKPAEQSAGVRLTAELEPRCERHAGVERCRVARDELPGAVGNPAAVHPDADLAAPVADGRIGRARGQTVAPPRAQSSLESGPVRTLAGVDDVGLGGGLRGGVWRHQGALNRPAHGRLPDGGGGHFLREPELAEPVPEIPRGGKERNARGGEAHGAEPGHERRLDADHDVRAGPPKPRRRGPHARLREEATIAGAILHAAEEIHLEVADEAASEHAVDRDDRAEPRLSNRHAERIVLRHGGGCQRRARHVDVVHAAKRQEEVRENPSGEIELQPRPRVHGAL